VQQALAAAADAPGYPTAAGTPRLRQSVVDWLARRHEVEVDRDAVVPTIGSKELVGLLPTLLGVRAGDTVVVPELAYPTYDVGVLLAGASSVRADGVAVLGPARPRLIWINSPANPTGRILPAEHLAKVVAWARERGTIVVSDECYLDLGWDAQPVSVLHPSVCGGSHDGLLAVHSLSKRSNLAGYRAGFVAGDPRLVGELLEVRKHAGLLVPWPVQQAMIAAYGDDEHVETQRARYSARRDELRKALQGAGFTVEHSQGGLYLWATQNADCWDTASALAEDPQRFVSYYDSMSSSTAVILASTEATQ